MDKDQKIETLLQKIDRLTKEYVRLKDLLSANGISYILSSKDNSNKNTHAEDKSNMQSAKYILTPQQKIDPFRNLFKGREDVFSRI